jgi:hypothetical protein
VQRSGQCKCGAILTFEQGPSGFKGRCPKCDAVVRLRVEEGATAPPATPPAASAAARRGNGRPPRPSDPRLSVVALRAPGPAEPGGPDPDATAPFEPIEEVVLEPWIAPAPAPKPSFLRQYRVALVVGGVTLAAVGAGIVVVLWRWFAP